MGMAEDLKADSAAAREVQSMALGIARRYYDGASKGRRTEGWRRSGGDSASTTRGAAATLRAVARDLVRNNAWARAAHRVIVNNTVGWGIAPRGLDPLTGAAWAKWGASRECDARGSLALSAIQRLVMSALVQDGEVLIVRHVSAQGRLMLEVLEADHIDTSKDSFGTTRQGIEFGPRGEPLAYWLFPDHPGSTDAMRREAVRVPAEDVIHVMRHERPGQIRGVSWFAPAVVKLHDFDDYQDALLVRQKIAACFSAFVRDMDGGAGPIGELDDGGQLETFEPGRIDYLRPGQDITFASPPGVPESEGQFAAHTLRSIAAAMSVTYEDMTGDYSQTNYSSARMGRLAHWASVTEWQETILIPQLMARVWEWWAPLATLSGVPVSGEPEWTAPSMPFVDPEKDARAFRALIRSGAMTHNELAASMGHDPRRHWEDYAAGLATLDELGIVLDSDPRRTSEQGQAQADAVTVDDATAQKTSGKVADS